MIVSLLSNRSERSTPGAELWAGGRVVVIEQARRDRGRWIMRFMDIDTRDEAETLRGAELTAERLPDVGDVLWVDDLVGLRLEDSGIDRGEITAVQQNPASDLLVLDSGALVPMGFVVDVSDDRVRADCPAGLFDLA